MRRRCALLPLLLLTCACSSVTTVQPVGSMAVTLDPADWQGTWCDPSEGLPSTRGIEVSASDDCVRLSVRDAAAGLLTLRPTGSSADETYTVAVRTTTSGATTFLTLVDTDTSHAFVRAVREKDLLVVWQPEVSGFAPLVTAKRLPGTVKVRTERDTDVVLTALGEADLDLIAADMERRLFRWQAPDVYVRIAR